MTNPSVFYNEDDIDEPKCPACNVPYIRHLGMSGTCAELLLVRSRYEKLRILSVPQFQNLLLRNTKLGTPFDDLVDQLPKVKND